MSNTLITEEVVKVKADCKTWQEAIHEGVNLLLNVKAVNESYEDAILKNFAELGPYMVIAPGIVLSHARPEDGVNKTSMSMLTLETPVEFGSDLNDPVTLVVTLAAADNTSHMSTLSHLMELFMDNEAMGEIFKASNKEEILNITNKYEI